MITFRVLFFLLIRYVSNCLGYCEERDAKRGWCSEQPLLVWPLPSEEVSWEAAAADEAAAAAAVYEQNHDAHRRFVGSSAHDATRIAPSVTSNPKPAALRAAPSSAAQQVHTKGTHVPQTSSKLSNACLMFDSDSD